MQRFIDEEIRGGRYASPEEVVQEALRRLREQDAGEEISGEQLRRLAAVGQAEADRGELLDAEEVFEELRERSRRRRATD